MDKKTEALEMAQELRALADRFSEGWHEGIKIDALDIELLAMAASAIEQPARQQEPVACTPQVWRQFRPDGTLEFQKIKRTPNGEWEDYTAPPKRELTCVCGAVWEGEMMVHPPRKREWVGLTAYEIQEIHSKNQHWGNFACAIEAKLKEKNT